MEKCLVCGKHDIGSGKCPVCGYKAPDAHEISEEDLKEELRYAKEERQGWLSKAKVEAKVYDYRGGKVQIKDGSINIQTPETGKIGVDLKDFDIDQVSWNEEKFINLSRDMELTISVTGTDGKTKDKLVKVKNPGVNGDTIQIGFALRPEFKVQILIGNEKKNVASELIPLK